MKYNCDWCGMEINIKPSRLSRQKNVFCSPMCYWNYKSRNQVTVSCYCCGKKFLLSPSLVGSRNFCSKSCATTTRNFENNPMNNEATRQKVCLQRLNTGIKKTYIKLNGMHLHRTVAEIMLGRPLKAIEIVHHIDGNIRNNEPSNLQVLSNQREHIKVHMLNGDFLSGTVKKV